MNRNRFIILLGSLTALFCALSVFYNFYTMPAYGQAVLQTAGGTAAASASAPASAASSAVSGMASSANSSGDAAYSAVTSASSATAVSGAAATASSSASLSPMNLNTATKQQLDGLPGIGPTLAQRIIDYRSAHGPFQSVDELDGVKGIGEKTLNKIRSYLYVR